MGLMSAKDGEIVYTCIPFYYVSGFSCCLFQFRSDDDGGGGGDGDDVAGDDSGDDDHV